MASNPYDQCPDSFFPHGRPRLLEDVRKEEAADREASPNCGPLYWKIHRLGVMQGIADRDLAGNPPNQVRRGLSPEAERWYADGYLEGYHRRSSICSRKPVSDEEYWDVVWNAMQPRLSEAGLR